ncbi:MAG: hypothetical protein ACR2K5_04660 [Pseudolabrys sp.]
MTMLRSTRRSRARLSEACCVKEGYGFAYVCSQPDNSWRLAGYRWDDDDLNRTVIAIDRVHVSRAVDAAYRFGNLLEVDLVARELRAWTASLDAANPTEAYLGAILT